MKHHFAGLTAQAFELPEQFDPNANTQDSNNLITQVEIYDLSDILELTYSFDQVIEEHIREGLREDLQITTWAAAINDQFDQIQARQRGNNIEINELIAQENDPDIDFDLQNIREHRQRLERENNRLQHIEPELKLYLKQIYQYLSRKDQAQLPYDAKCTQIVGNLAQPIFQCSEGFHESAQQAVSLLNQITTLNELLCQARTDLAREFANGFLNRQNLNDMGHGVHNYAWLLNQAYQHYQIIPQGQNGIRNINQMPNLENRAITELHECFQNAYQYHKLTTFILEALQKHIIQPELGYYYEQHLFTGQMFNPNQHNWFIDTLKTIFQIEETEFFSVHTILNLDDDYQVNGINWGHIHYALWHQLKQLRFLTTQPTYPDLHYPFQQAKASYYLLALAKLRYKCRQQYSQFQNNANISDDQLQNEAVQILQQDIDQLTIEIEHAFNNLEQHHQLINITRQAVIQAYFHDSLEAIEAIVQTISQHRHDSVLTIIRPLSISEDNDTECGHMSTPNAREQFIKTLRDNLDSDTFCQWLASDDPYLTTRNRDSVDSIDDHDLSIEERRPPQYLMNNRPHKRINLINNNHPELVQQCLPPEGTPSRDYLNAIMEAGNHTHQYVPSPLSEAASALHQAVIQGDTERVRQIVSEQPHTAMALEPSYGDSALMIAARRGYITIAEHILDYQPDCATLRNHSGETALEQAAYQEHVELIKTIVEYNPDAVNTRGSPQPFDNNFIRLYNKPTRYADGPLISDISEHPTLVIKSCRSTSVGDSFDGPCPLIQCLHLFQQSPSLLDHLLNHGADLNVTSTNNSLALHEACAQGLTDIAEHLIAQGAQIDYGFEGHTPLSLTAKLGHTDTLLMLLKYGANINPPYPNHPLQEAAMFRHKHLVKLLIEHGADTQIRNLDLIDDDIKSIIETNKPDSQGQLPLFTGIILNDFDQVKLLIDEGALVNLTDNTQQTPLELAINHRPIDPQALQTNWRIIQLLVENNASLPPLFNNPQTWQTLLNYPQLYDMLNANCPDANGDTPLVKLIRSGDDPESVHNLISQGALVNKYDQYGRTPVHVAAHYSRRDTLNALIHYGANVAAKDARLNLPLHLAAAYADEPTLTALLYNMTQTSHPQLTTALNLEENAPIDLALQHNNFRAVDLLAQKRAFLADPDSDYPSTVHKAICRQQTIGFEILHEYNPYTDIQNDLKAAILYNPDCIKLLIRDGADPTQESFNREPALHLAAKFGCYKALSILLDHTTEHINETSVFCLTALHNALLFRQFECAQLLIGHQADVNTGIRYNGNTVLHTAIPHQNLDIIKTLIAHGSHINRANHEGFTPLHEALKWCHFDIATLLINQPNIDLNCPSQGRYTYPLHLAIGKQAFVLAQQMIEKGANVNLADRQGDTPLHLALSKGAFDLAKQILTKDVNVNLINRQGDTPLHLALSKQAFDLAKQILTKDVNVNLVNQQGDPPLHLALSKQAFALAHQIIDKGADVNQTNHRGEAPIHLALSQPNLVDKLIQKGAKPNSQHRRKTPLRLAIEQGYLETAQVLVRNNCFHQMTKETLTALSQWFFCSAQENTPDQFGSLIRNNLPINYCMNKPSAIKAFITQHNLMPQHTHFPNNFDHLLNEVADEPLLNVATQIGNIDFMQALINEQAYVNIKDRLGKTPIHAAIQNFVEQYYPTNRQSNAIQPLRRLLTPSCQFWGNSDALSGTLATIEVLMNNGADINAPDTEGTTPLHKAIRHGHLIIVQKLLEHQADITIENNDGLRPSQMINGKAYPLDHLRDLVNYLKTVDTLSPAYICNCLVDSFDAHIIQPQIDRMRQEPSKMQQTANRELKIETLQALKGGNSPLRQLINQHLEHYIPSGNAPIHFDQIFKDLAHQTQLKARQKLDREDHLSRFAHILKKHQNCLTAPFIWPTSWSKVTSQLSLFAQANTPQPQQTIDGHNTLPPRAIQAPS